VTEKQNPPASAADPRLLEEFRLAEEARALYSELHWPIEPWIALQLARTDRGILRGELERLSGLRKAGRAASPGGLVADSLDRINLAMSRSARDLRSLLAASGVLPDPIRLELVLALLLRDGASTPLPGEIRLRAAEIELYLRAPPPSPSNKVEEVPEGVDRELLRDLRHLRAYFGPLAGVRPRLELWEAFSLAVSKTADALDVDGLYGALVEVRLRKAQIARGLRRYVSELPIGHYAYDTMELAFAFILTSPEGCCRARQWMESPEQFKREAAIRVEGVIGRAQKYLQALRATA
jgi:hypothetical protein